MNINKFRYFFIATAFIVFCGISLTALGDDYTTITGTFDYEYANDILQLVNEIRATNGLEALVLTDNLTDAAMKRAAEITVDFSDTRPNSDSCFTAFSWSGDGYVGENRAYGQMDPEEVMTVWMESANEVENILSTNFLSMGAGCFLYDTTFYWVQIFSSKIGDPETCTDKLAATIDISLVSGKDSIVNDGRKKYSVAFNANGGYGTMANQTMTYGTAKNLRENSFTRYDYLFLGWAKTKNGDVAYKNGASVKNLTTEAGETVTLYAKWAKKKYKVAFYANGGKGTMNTQTMTYGKASKLSKNSFTRSDYVFTGWAKSKNGAVVYKNNQSVKNLTETGKTINLYAKWIKKTYRIAFYANGGTGKMAAQKMIYGKASKLSKNTFTRSNYVFLGWAKSKSGTVVYKNKQSVKNLTKRGKTIKLYAKWAKKNYKVAFYANGGTGKMAAQKMIYGKAQKLSANKFKRTGYAFMGWAKSKALAKKGKVAYKNKKSVKNLITNGKTIKLYAVWKKRT